jgi:uncharacterized protein YbaP (TraB family)
MFKWSSKFAVRFLVLAALAAVYAQAQQPAAAQQSALARRFLMWKVSSPTAAVYLVGSIHVGDNSMYPLPAGVESAFAASKVLAVEINIKNVDQSKALQMVQEYGTYAGSDTLSQHISRETSDALDDYCSKHGLPRAALEKFKPWLVAITIITIAAREAGEDSALGIDMHFLNAIKEPQRIGELETAEFQLSIFANATEEEQQGLLADELKHVDKLKDVMRKIQDAYMSGDGERLQKLMDEENTGPKSLTKKLLDDRNVGMAGKVEGFLKGKDQIFVVVGAAHLVGDKGVIKLLRDKGYRVEQVVLDSK